MVLQAQRALSDACNRFDRIDHIENGQFGRRLYQGDAAAEPTLGLHDPGPA
jgi:hypothetical protein